MTRVIDISAYEKELNILERAYLEVSGRENIINFMLNGGRNNTPEYQEYWSEYIQYLKAYNQIKDNFTINCVNKVLDKPSNGTWQVNFTTKEITINERD